MSTMFPVRLFSHWLDSPKECATSTSSLMSMKKSRFCHRLYDRSAQGKLRGGRSPAHEEFTAFLYGIGSFIVLSISSIVNIFIVNL